MAREFVRGLGHSGPRKQLASQIQVASSVRAARFTMMHGVDHCKPWCSVDMGKQNVVPKRCGSGATMEKCPSAFKSGGATNISMAKKSSGRRPTRRKPSRRKGRENDWWTSGPEEVGYARKSKAAVKNKDVHRSNLQLLEPTGAARIPDERAGERQVGEGSRDGRALVRAQAFVEYPRPTNLSTGVAFRYYTPAGNAISARNSHGVANFALHQALPDRLVHCATFESVVIILATPARVSRIRSPRTFGTFLTDFVEGGVSDLFDGDAIGREALDVILHL